MGNQTFGGRPRAAVLENLQRMVAEIAVKQRRPPTSKAEIARFCGVDTTTLWRHANGDPAVSELIAELVRVSQPACESPNRDEDFTREPLQLLPESDSPLANLTSEDLAHRAAKPVRTAESAAKGWVARARKVKHVSDLPAALYHLQKAQRQINRALEDLKPLTDEWLRRSRRETGAGGDSQLRLD